MNGHWNHNKFRWGDFIISVTGCMSEPVRLGCWKAAKVKNRGMIGDHFTHFRYRESNQPLTWKVTLSIMLWDPNSGVWYRQSGTARSVTIYRGLENLDKFHGQVNGIFTGDEHFGKNPSKGQSSVQ